VHEIKPHQQKSCFPNRAWKRGQGRCIPSVRLVSHQMISLIHANYTEWKLIRRNHSSANEDLGHFLGHYLVAHTSSLKPNYNSKKALPCYLVPFNTKISKTTAKNNA